MGDASKIKVQVGQTWSLGNWNPHKISRISSDVAWQIDSNGTEEVFCHLTEEGYAQLSSDEWVVTGPGTDTERCKMKPSQIKLQVGQVWKEIPSNPKYVYKIVDISDNKAWYRHDHWPADYADECFVELTEDGLGRDVSDDWEVTGPGVDVPGSPTAQASTSEVDHGAVAMAFFSSVPEGWCKCNTPRSQCDYHR
jgi:hypothetical protein